MYRRLLDLLPGWARRVATDPDVIQFVLFVLVGCAAAVGHYGVLIALCEGFDVDPVPGSAAGFIIGGLISYHLNYGHVFRSDQAHLPTAGKFIAVAVIGLGFNSLIMWLLAEEFGLHYLLAQVSATLAVMLWSFTANRFWTFADGTPDRTA